MRRGEIWGADLGLPWRRRPVLLLSRDTAYSLLTRVIVAPLTSRIRQSGSLVLLDPRLDRVPETSVVSLDNLQAIEKDRLTQLLVPLRPEKLLEVEAALRFALGLRD